MFHSLVKLLTLLHQIMEKRERATEESLSGGKYSHTQGMQGGSVFDDNNYKQVKQFKYDIIDRYLITLEKLYKEYIELKTQYNAIKDKKYDEDPITSTYRNTSITLSIRSKRW